MNGLGDLLIGVTGFLAGITFLGWSAWLLGWDDGGLYGGERATESVARKRAAVQVLEEGVGFQRGEWAADAHLPTLRGDHDRRATTEGGER